MRTDIKHNADLGIHAISDAGCVIVKEKGGQQAIQSVPLQLLEYQGRRASSDKPVEMLQCVVPLQAHYEERPMYRYVVQHNPDHQVALRMAG